MQVFAFGTYCEVVEAALAGLNGERRRGVGALSLHLKVHPTFISKVLQGKAHFSMEHAVAFCQYQRFSSAATEYFVDLVNHDRCGDEATRAHFATRLSKHRSQHENLRERLASDRQMSVEQQLTYYESWLPQAVHMQCQLHGKHTRESISTALKISSDIVGDAVRKLLHLGILTEEGRYLKSVVEFIHTGKDSPLLPRLHINWRQKVIGDLMLRPDSEGVHFSAVAALSGATERSIRLQFVDQLQKMKAEIATSPPEKLCAISLDFYAL